MCVPQQRTQTFNVTTYKCVPEQMTQTYTVCVPVQVQKEVQVQVCKMVPKTVMVPATSGCAPANCCGGCGAPVAAGCGCGG